MAFGFARDLKKWWYNDPQITVKNLSFIDGVIDVWFLISFLHFLTSLKYTFFVKPHHSKNWNGDVLHLSLLPLMLLIMINTFLMIGKSVSFVIARNGKFFIIVSHIHFHKQIALRTKLMSNNKIIIMYQKFLLQKCAKNQSK